MAGSDANFRSGLYFPVIHPPPPNNRIEYKRILYFQSWTLVGIKQTTYELFDYTKTHTHSHPHSLTPTHKNRTSSKIRTAKKLIEYKQQVAHADTCYFWVNYENEKMINDD